MKSDLKILIVLCLLTVACKNNTEQTPVSNNERIEITKAQFKMEEMVFGRPVLRPFTNFVYFTGTIFPNVNGQAQISLPLPGKINKIHYSPGQFVNKNSVLYTVSGNEFIDIQKDFAVSSATLSKLKSDFIRAKELYDDTIASHKDFILAESNYYAENATYNALKIKLESLGLDVLKIEKGEFYSSYSLKSPIRGYVTSIDAAIGQYVEPQQKIAEITDAQSYQLRLYVFEKNIAKIKPNQQVAFYLDGDKSVKYKAKIISVGKSILSDSKSIECYAEIEDFKNTHIVGNQFVEGEVFVSTDSVLSVPETAIINSENNSYLLAFENETDSIYYFQKIKVTPVRKSNNYVELSEDITSNKIVIKGIYNIQIE